MPTLTISYDDRHEARVACLVAEDIRMEKCDQAMDERRKCTDIAYWHESAIKWRSRAVAARKAFEALS